MADLLPGPVSARASLSALTVELIELERARFETYLRVLEEIGRIQAEQARILEEETERLERKLTQPWWFRG